MNIKTFKTADQAVAYIDLTDLTEKQKVEARYQVALLDLQELPEIKKNKYHIQQDDIFNYLAIGGIDTEKTKRADLRLCDDNYNFIKKTLHIQLYEFKTGTIELNYYIN